MVLSCRPRLQRIGGFWRRCLCRSEGSYSALKDAEDCHWLLASQPPHTYKIITKRESNGMVQVVWKDQSGLTSSDDDDYDGNDEEGSMCLCCDGPDNSHDGDEGSALLLKPLAPPSETDDSDTEDVYDQSTMASLADFLRRIARPEPAVHTSNDLDEDATVGSSSSSSTDLKSTATSRSIRFADEVDGCELEIIHLVPWSEQDKDEKWLPRRVRCRVEL
jgi:hypothetical protein